MALLSKPCYDLHILYIHLFSKARENMLSSNLVVSSIPPWQLIVSLLLLVAVQQQHVTVTKLRN
jgi:hypothetical protein